MRFFYLIRALLREIFDEAAYERFCMREGLGVTKESYAQFSRNAASPAKKKIRCC